MEKKKFTRRELFNYYPFSYYKFGFIVCVSLVIINLLIFIIGFAENTYAQVLILIMGVFLFVEFIGFPILNIRETIDLVLIKIGYIEGVLLKAEEDPFNTWGKRITIVNNDEKKVLRKLVSDQLKILI